MKEYKEIFEALVAGKQIQLQIDGTWADQQAERVLWLIAQGTSAVRFRIKPATVTVNGIEVPEPWYGPVEQMSDVWTVGVASVDHLIWRNDAEYCLALQRNGAVHLSKENAQAHYDALWAPTRRGV